ncbi:hypothetical protein GALMADRAFT_232077 [Galerina marginata CBS 339.88]|uniref:Macrofage activating glycoprotein n=1 Tax=Galerina marginata (strain CBS 339.88) TaxID=685588 RepID=A0A067S956_GALM3|nr:hypothetical protein GALMADRAFT_232077 [Galerina marginata CBS 339.88]
MAMISQAILATVLLPLVQGQGFTPLANLNFSWFDLPYQADVDPTGIRGPQAGYNICNSTTEGPNSLCQTAFINSLDDFCIWAPPTPGQTVGQIEGEMVAWCTRPGHGTRIMPPGTLTGVQLTKTPDYIQVVGFMNQTLIDMVGGDGGGEMDPHGADNRGNPIGGLLFSNAWTGTFLQAKEWHDFNGNDMFCFKACDPRGANAANLCQHIFDTEGCSFNAPSNAKDGVFESCAGDSQNPPGQGAPIVPSSSLCSQFQSTDIYDRGTQVPVPGASTISFSSTPIPTFSKTLTSTTVASTGSSSLAGSKPTETSNATAAQLSPVVVSVCLFAAFLLMV